VNARPSPLDRLARSKPDPLTSVVLTIPVFLVYHLGVLLIEFRNGADLISGLTFQLLEASVPGYIGATLAVAAGLALSAYVQRRRGRVKPTALGPILLESVGWALLMLVSVGWATAQLTAALSLGEAMGPVDKIVMAAGAGFHEELVFRVGLLSGGVYLLQRIRGTGVKTAWAVALIASSLIFSAVHHIGPMSDAFTLEVFAFRTLAGVYLAMVYALRGFAIVVYTHALYDILVFFVFS